MAKAIDTDVLTTRVPSTEARAVRVVARAQGRTTSGLLAHLARRHVAEYLAETEGGPGDDGPEPAERPREGAHARAS